MARRRSVSNKGRRGYTTTANFDPMLPFLDGDLYHVEDRRLFHPDKPFNYPIAIPATAARVTVKRKRPYQFSMKKELAKSKHKLNLSYSDPARVVVCVKRKVRKEVLHALRKTGKKGQRKPRRNNFSDIHC